MRSILAERAAGADAYFNNRPYDFEQTDAWQDGYLQAERAQEDREDEGR